MLERLLLKLFRHTDITKEDSLYLRRFFLFSSRSFGVYLHKICRSDDDKDPHDHPWDFATLVLSGGYTDEAYDWSADGGRTQRPPTPCKPGRLYFRRAEHLHQVKLHSICCEADDCPWAYRLPAWTLVFRGPIKRRWNFVTERGPVYWREYLDFWGEDGNEGGAKAEVSP